MLAAVTVVACDSADQTELGDDPLFIDQWYLLNTGQRGGQVGEDLDVVPVWAAGIEGRGVVVAIVDDGIDADHSDLTGNVLIDGTAATGPGTHGTAIAGVIAARAGNGRGGKGVAPAAQVLAVDLLAAGPAGLANAMTRHLDDVDIVNGSWGNVDMTGRFSPADAAWQAAVEYGLIAGRDGKGIIYVWAAGNGGSGEIDRSSYDGYPGFHGVIAVGAIGNDGARSRFSEQGANLLVCAPSMGNDGVGITTTDTSGSGGVNDGSAPLDYLDPDYTNSFTGTSAAAPMVAGVVALMLEANPELGWRDVRLILASTARVNDSDDDDWRINGAGHWINHQYGFGAVSARRAVEAARVWQPRPPAIVYSSTAVVDTTVPDDDAHGLSIDIEVVGSGIGAMESVEVDLSIPDHPDAGDLEIVLTSPAGTPSVLANPHRCNTPCGPLSAWTFTTVRLLDEAADGTWTLTVRDQVLGATGTLASWSLRMSGRP